MGAVTYNAVTGTMCFSEALAGMKKGQSVRRRSWPVGRQCVTQRDGAFYQRSALSTGGCIVMHCSLSTADILAEDWEDAVLPWNAKP